jgi:hypothetical protein
MSKEITLKAIHNSRTKAISSQLPKKKLPESIQKNFDKIKSIRVKLEDLDFEYD